MKQDIYTITKHVKLTDDVMLMTLEGDTSAITASGQFINIKLEGKYLRRPISICDYNDKEIIIVYKNTG